jgi:hypothetical protein
VTVGEGDEKEEAKSREHESEGLGRESKSGGGRDGKWGKED